MLFPVFAGAFPGLFPKDTAEIAAGTDAIKDINAKDESVVNVYTLDGVQLRHNVDADKATEGLAKGVYVVGTKKVVVR